MENAGLPRDTHVEMHGEIPPHGGPRVGGWVGQTQLSAKKENTMGQSRTHTDKSTKFGTNTHTESVRLKAVSSNLSTRTMDHLWWNPSNQKYFHN